MSGDLIRWCYRNVGRGWTVKHLDGATILPTLGRPVLECNIDMGCRHKELIGSLSLREVVDLWKSHLQDAHGILLEEEEDIELGSRVSTPGGRIGKVVDIDPQAYYPVLVRFEFDGYAYKMSDLKLVRG